MKTLFLARHAKSSWKHPELPDHDRPLNRRGRDDLPRMGSFLAVHYAPPQYLVTRSAVRARTTARSLARAFGLTLDVVVETPRLYRADVTDLLAIVRDLPNECDRSMRVGHDPVMTASLNLISGADLDHLPTCGVARIESAVVDWRAFRPGDGRLMSLDTPKSLAGVSGT